ncbi:hypothetical protein HCA55_03715 [Listeria booriae]|uniref:Bacterial Ig domain-containing protein n=1 Tax=Listeria booriae TaxID=1552123 RepID=A0A842AVQ2_9LIST|nr:toxin Cry1Ac domain D-VI-related protein [Listeria booriae]MBC1795816.1 hypothetical protein [Listeria booriae]
MSKKTKMFNKSLKLFLASAMLLTSVSTLPINTLANEGITNPSVDAVGVYVSDWATFKTELQNATTTDIYLQADLRMTDADFSISVDEKNIHGEGYTIDMNTRNIRVTKANAVTSINNITIKNSGTNGFLWSTVAAKHTVNNVTGDGNRSFARLEAGTLVFQGTNNITQLNGNNNYNVWAKNIEIQSNAEVNITGGGYSRDRGALHTTRGSVLTVAEGAKLNVTSTTGQAIRLDEANFTNNGFVKATSSRDGIATYNASTTTVNSGATLDIKSTATDVQGAMFNNSSLFVKSGATLIAVSQGSSSTLTTGKELVIEEGANFSITNTRNGALGSESNATTMVINSTIGVSTWERNKTTLEEPTFSYQGPLNMRFSLSGYAGPKQTSLVTDNADITKNFDTSKIGRIEGGYFVKDPKQIEAEDKARVAVNNLFTSQNPANDAKAGLTQAEIDAAQVLVDKVTDPAKKAELQADLDKAQQKLDAQAAAELAAQNKAREAVNNLFANQNPTGDTKAGLTQAEIDAAQALIDQVTDPAKKAELQADLNKAQTQLDAQKAAELAAQNKAQEAVNNLFASQNPANDAKAGLTQAEIDAAQALIDQVTDPAKKAELQADLNKAQEQIDADKAAEKAAQDKARAAVNNLFANQNPTGDTKTGLTQAEIDAAQALINQVTDPAKKAELQADLNKAQTQLDAQKAAELAAQNKAQEAVNNLFASQNPANDAKAGLTQAEIDAAQALINQVTDPAKKAELQASLDKAQQQLDADKAAELAAQAKAREAVNNLFASQNPNGDLKTGLTQAEIDAAQALIDQVTDPAKKAELQADLNKAQQQLNANLVAPNAPQVNNVTDVDTKITGKGQAGTTAVVKLADGTEKTGLVNASGDFSIVIPKQVAASTISVTLKNAYGVVSEATTVTVSGLPQPVINPITISDVTVSGTIDVSQYPVTKVRLSINGAPKTILTVGADGSFSYYTGNLAVGTTIEVQYIGPSGAYLTDSLYTGAAVVTEQEVSLVLNDMTVADLYITGTTLANHRVRVSINGLLKATVTADASGNFSYLSSYLVKGDVVKAEVLLGANVAKTASITVAEAAATELVVNEMTIADNTVKGTATPNAKLRININGVAKAVVTADASGNYSYVTGSLVSGTEVKVEQRNAFTGAYDTSKTVIISGEIPGLLLTLNDLKAPEGIVSGEATAGYTVRISVNGTVRANTVADASGNYTYNVGVLTGGDVVKAEIRVGSEYLLPTEKIVKAEFSLNPILDTDRTITGKAPAGKTVRISINGVPKSITVVDAAGNYTYLIGLVATGDVIKIELRDTETGKYEEFVERTVTAESEAGQVTINALTDADTTISGKTVPSGKLRVSVDGRAKTVITADADGNYSYFISGIKADEVIKVELKENGVYGPFAETTVTAAPVAE